MPAPLDLYLKRNAHLAILTLGTITVWFELGCLFFFFFFLIFFFWCGSFLMSLLNLLQYCFCFVVLVLWLPGMWDLRSLIRDQTQSPWTKRWSLNHWSTREVSGMSSESEIILTNILWLPFLCVSSPSSSCYSPISPAPLLPCFIFPVFLFSPPPSSLLSPPLLSPSSLSQTQWIFVICIYELFDKHTSPTTLQILYLQKHLTR